MVVPGSLGWRLLLFTTTRWAFSSSWDPQNSGRNSETNIGRSFGPAATALWAPGGQGALGPAPLPPPAEGPGFRNSGLQHLAQTGKPEK